MKHLFILLMSSMIMSYGCFYSQNGLIQAVPGITLPPYSIQDAQNNVFRDLIPAFQLPQGIEILNNSFFNYSNKTKVELLDHGWTATLQGVSAGIDKDVVQMYLHGSGLFGGQPMASKSPWNNDMQAIEQNFCNEHFSGNLNGVFVSKYVWLDIEGYWWEMPNDFDIMHYSLPSNLVGNSSAIASAYPGVLNSFHNAFIEMVRTHMSPSTKLFIYGTGAGYTRQPFYYYYQGQPYAPTCEAPLGWTAGNGLGGGAYNSLDYTSVQFYTSRRSCWPNTPSSLTYCDTLLAVDDFLTNNIIGIEEYNDLVGKNFPNNSSYNCIASSPHKPLMYFNSLATFSWDSPIGLSETGYLGKEDSQAEGIFPLMMGQKSMLIWDSYQDRNFTTWYEYQNHTYNTGNSYYTEEMFNRMMVRGQHESYEQFRNGLYRMSQFPQYLDGNYEYYKPENLWDLIAHNSHCRNNENGLTYNDVRPFWRAIRKGNKILIAAQNFSAPFYSNGQKSFTLSYTENGYNFSTTITLTGREVFLGEFCLTNDCTGSSCDALTWGVNTTITCNGITTQMVSTTGSSSVEYSTDNGSTWHASNGSNNQYTWSFPASMNQINYLARTVGCSDSQYYLPGNLLGQSNDCPTNSISDLRGTRILMNPNPANEVVTFQGLKTEKINHFRIVSISGKVIEALEVIEDKMAVNVSRFEPGIYMVIFEGENSRLTKKLIKN